jgi:nitrogen fixation protein FixH
LAVRNAINQAVNAAIILQGDWNAATNTPNLQVTGITTGFAWRVSASGTTNLGGITLWAIGDLAIKSATGWIRMVSEDIAAIWGNISGTLSNQTDLQNALNLKLNSSTFATYTGTTVPNTYYNKTQINAYSASTLTQINSKVATTTFSTYTGTTVPNTYYNKTQINAYTAQTQTQINSKLNTSVFTGYTASTKNVDKKIQVISTLTLNANVVTPLEVTWSSVPVSADTYLWSGGTAVWIKSAGEYEVNYHIVLTNNAANQTHSIGSNLLLNGSTNPLTAGATNVVGSNSSAEISLNSAVLTLANNDRLDLAVFRIGNSGNANLVSGSTYLVLNKLS